LKSVRFGGALRQAKIFIEVNEQTEHRARDLMEAGIKPLDALHLASAEQAQVDIIFAHVMTSS